ncbi:hypothetical protein [Corallococcus macrosporus]|uniref:Uncharacterized protein n=1 Tax=Myxococcus fulvus (strain ATCC BAA-855 / HW-1) TaxID=483219 RepID=F8CKB9_MYXFH|nr:hypothetical protein [Corallococcus macrosporus]AEI67675.1 hypothetical protein LILAB_28970 [Corallococcus macrosporus]
MAKWDDLVLAIPPHAGGRLEVPAPAALLETLLGLHDVQLTLLRGLRRELRPLQEGPFHAGRTHLEAARVAHAPRDEQLERLKAARGCFTEAMGMERDKARLSFIALHLGLCWLLLGAERDAREWTQLAHRTAVEAMKDILVDASKHQGLTRNRYLDPAITFFMFFTSAATLGAGYLFWDRVLSKRTGTVMRRALVQMQSLADYVDALGEIRLRLGELPHDVARYELTHGVDEQQFVARITIRKLINDREAIYFNGRETRKVTWNDQERSEVITRELL